jgi:hypothetical protein
MSESERKQQEPAQSPDVSDGPVSDETLESVAGGVRPGTGGCVPPIKIDPIIDDPIVIDDPIIEIYCPPPDVELL